VRRFGLFLLGAIVALGQQRNFVSCPIVRDTKTVPCFLAEYEGETYYLGIQQDITSDFHPPQLKHEVLVEGRVAPGPRVCGGIPLQPVSISTLKEVNLACSTLLPAEPGLDAPPAPRGPGPSSRRAEAVLKPRGARAKLRPAGRNSRFFIRSTTTIWNMPPIKWSPKPRPTPTGSERRT